jgi:hypothetical protein
LKNFFEFPGETARRLVEEVPNNGLICYYTAGNAEKLLVIGSDALSDVLVKRTYDFEKPSFVRTSLSLFADSGLLVAEGEEHKGSSVYLSQAF